MSHYEKYLKYKNKYLNLQKQIGGGDAVVGDRVRERDSLMTGVVIEIHDKYGYTHIVMQGDDGKIYDHNTGHYYKLSEESDYDRAEVESELQQRAQKKAEQKINDKRNGRLLEIGDRVRERDSSMTGVVIKVYESFGFTHIVMKGDDGKNYDYNITHYRFLENENKDDTESHKKIILYYK